MVVGVRGRVCSSSSTAQQQQQAGGGGCVRLRRLLPGAASRMLACPTPFSSWGVSRAMPKLPYLDYVVP